jgi:hypothetical protein
MRLICGSVAGKKQLAKSSPPILGQSFRIVNRFAEKKIIYAYNGE